MRQVQVAGEEQYLLVLVGELEKRFDRRLRPNLVEIDPDSIDGLPRKLDSEPFDGRALEFIANLRFDKSEPGQFAVVFQHTDQLLDASQLFEGRLEIAIQLDEIGMQGIDPLLILVG